MTAIESNQPERQTISQDLANEVMSRLHKARGICRIVEQSSEQPETGDQLGAMWAASDLITEALHLVDGAKNTRGLRII